MPNNRNTGQRRAMGGRRKARELTVQALYQSELAGVAVEEAVEQLCQDAGERADLDYFRRLAGGIARRLPELDGWIDTAVQKWTPERISIVDRNVMRLGIYELLAEPDVPRNVAINEAIELSKRFGGEGSGRFVNGILDQVAAQVRKDGDPGEE
ncbi:MAG: transcription antitermination factor NusB [Magnetococcales bacterium]|nr:transcription antitermination factor NusB [Magnetococcales bacterium]